MMEENFQKEGSQVGGNAHRIIVFISYIFKTCPITLGGSFSWVPFLFKDIRNSTSLQSLP